MTARETADTEPWPIGFRVRPAVDPTSPRVEVADTVTGRRFHWTPEALADYVLRGGGPDAPRGDGSAWRTVVDDARDRDHLLPGWLHWKERSWYPSDQYYVASRRWDFADTVDTDESIRTGTVRDYLAHDGPPPAERLPDGPVAPLGPPAPPGEQDVATLLVTRRSGRAYVPRPTPLARLSGLLWHGFAEFRARRERTGPSSPMSYLDSYGSAWDVHLCVFDVAGLDPGTYRYDLVRHELIGIKPGDHRAAVEDVLQGMRSPATAAWTLGLVADVPRYQWRYRHEHGLRRLYLEAGIIAQELLVLGMSYGLSTLVTPAQKDSPYLALHGLSADRYAPVYTLTQGMSRGAAGVHFNGEPLEQHGAR
ncbi:SagB/ThcOx family dehydrogenase [Saccharothrix lopnurensis]|uniref:SagB/ThcOx family dehydrogenase n=1 Tax=Saccharothrix lopnurensis TaxID=1670621 RepID=A0ABW1PA21_9PSEU